MIHSMQVSTEGAYKVEGWSPGIAWRCLGPVMIRDADYEWTGIEEPDPQLVRMVMVGDDTVHIVDADDLVRLDETEFCPECGQVGCGWGAVSES